MPFKGFFTFGSAGLAIDLGTANTVVYVPNVGIVLAEPSVVALETVNGVQRVWAVGDEAKLMLGKTPENVRAVRPLRHGVVADIEIAEHMIKHFMRKAQGARGLLRRGSEVVISVPSLSTSVERRAIRDAVSNAGARQVWLIDEPLAAAIGADLPVTQPQGSMIVDIGGGTTEVGVVSIRGLTTSMSLRVGGDRMDEAIAAAVRRNHNLLIGEGTAERLKIQLGTARMKKGAKNKSVRVKGRDLARGVPTDVEITQRELADALAEPLAQIIQTVRATLEKTPPEIAADLVDAGITLAGGGSLLREIGPVLSEATGLPVRIAEDPLNCVALGAGRALEQDDFRAVLQAG